MASGGHSLQQQKQSVEARVKTLINHDLKEICRTYGLNVSGTKAVLQARCIKRKSATWMILRANVCLAQFSNPASL